MLVKYFSIRPCTFGLYEAIPDLEECQEDTDIFNGSSEEVYKLGSENLPDWVEDIRGKIIGEPEQVFIKRSGSNQEHICYFGFNNAELID